MAEKTIGTLIADQISILASTAARRSADEPYARDIWPEERKAHVEIGRLLDKALSAFTEEGGR